MDEEQTAKKLLQEYTNLPMDVIEFCIAPFLMTDWRKKFNVTIRSIDEGAWNFQRSHTHKWGERHTFRERFIDNMCRVRP